MLELLDQYQRLEIALKLSRGRKKKAEHGGYAGGGVMFGYRVKKGQKVLEVDAEKAVVVRRLFELRHYFYSIGRTIECRGLLFRERETIYESTSETHVRPRELLSRDIHIWSNTGKR